MKTFADVVSKFIGVLDKVIPLIVTLAVVTFMWGLLKYVRAGGSEDKIKEARDYIFYGIIGLAVMVSVWGLVKIVNRTLFSRAPLNEVRDIDDDTQRLRDLDLFQRGV
ncbi:MAG: hypothetical protein HYT43_02185 [Candidatus Taylorbacteria bacterium]|nr:hypothetical protein [Candidatus Taylorbacteria bacterium]